MMEIEACLYLVTVEATMTGIEILTVQHYTTHIHTHTHTHTHTVLAYRRTLPESVSGVTCDRVHRLSSQAEIC